MINPSHQAKLVTKIIIGLVILNFVFLFGSNFFTSQSADDHGRKLQELASVKPVKTNENDSSSDLSDIDSDDDSISSDLHDTTTDTDRIVSSESEDSSESDIDEITFDLQGTTDMKTYEFKSPSLAFQILNQLDVFTPVDPSYLWFGRKKPEQYDKPYLGMKNDDEYCLKHRAMFVEQPDIVFENFNFVMESGPITLLRRKVAKVIGTDIMPRVGKHQSQEMQDSFTIDVSPAATFFHSVMGMQRYKHVGKHFACLSQQFNHIPGHFSLNRKDTIAENAIKYGKLFTDRPQCFNNQKYFPDTWLLYDKESCLDFFARVQSPEHAKRRETNNILYIMKIGAGSHRGQGVTPLDEPAELELIKEFDYGKKCGRIQKNLIVQHYIPNPLLLDDRKFDFRMYMVVASSNPLMVFYHDGFLRVSLYEYDEENVDKKVLLTNLALNKEIYADAAKGKLSFGMSSEDLRIAQQWSFERLENYLLEKKVISDPNWLDNYLRPELKRAMIHLSRMASHTFLKVSSVYEFYGVDFMLDDNLTLWFIEANSGPALDGYSQPMEKFIVQMLKDHFDLVLQLLRSRMKRVVLLVNKIVQNKQYVKTADGQIKITNLEQWREAFNKITTNYYEPDFQIRPDNGYSLILDDNLEGAAKYMGLISEECI